jgi:hypothetical protein
MASLTTLSVVPRLCRVEQDDDLWIMKWKGCRRGQKWQNLRHFPGVQLNWLKKSLSLDLRSRSWDRTRDLPNIKLEFYPLQHRWTTDKCTWKSFRRHITYCVKWNMTETVYVLERVKIIYQNNYNFILCENNTNDRNMKNILFIRNRSIFIFLTEITGKMGRQHSCFVFGASQFQNMVLKSTFWLRLFTFFLSSSR